MFAFAWAAFSALLAFLIVRRGYKKKSLAKDGAVAGLVVGCCPLPPSPVFFLFSRLLPPHIGFFVGFLCLVSSLRFGLVLIAFFFTSSALTKMGAERKKKIEHDFKEGTPDQARVASGPKDAPLCPQQTTADMQILCISLALHVVHAQAVSGAQCRSCPMGWAGRSSRCSGSAPLAPRTRSSTPGCS